MPIWSLCHLPTDGKEPAAFAVCQQMAKSRALCRLPADGKESCPLPSATDGKGLFAVRCKKQTAKKAFADPVFAVTVCRPRRTAKAFAVRHPSLCRPPWLMAKYQIPVVFSYSIRSHH